MSSLLPIYPHLKGNGRVIAVDVDEVCADLLGRWLHIFNLEHKTKILPEDITAWQIEPFLPQGKKNAFYDILRHRKLYEDVLPIPYARLAITRLRASGFRIIYVSSCVPGTIEDKRDWLVRWGFLSDNLKERDFFPATDKSRIRADYLFDDRPENVERFLGKGVLVRRAHNQHCTHLPSVDCLLDVPGFLWREEMKSAVEHHAP